LLKHIFTITFDQSKVALIKKKKNYSFGCHWPQFWNSVKSKAKLDHLPFYIF